MERKKYSIIVILFILTFLIGCTTTNKELELAPNNSINNNNDKVIIEDIKLNLKEEFEQNFNSKYFIYEEKISFEPSTYLQKSGVNEGFKYKFTLPNCEGTNNLVVMEYNTSNIEVLLETLKSDTYECKPIIVNNVDATQCNYENSIELTNYYSINEEIIFTNSNSKVYLIAEMLTLKTPIYLWDCSQDNISDELYNLAKFVEEKIV